MTTNQTYSSPAEIQTATKRSSLLKKLVIVSALLISTAVSAPRAEARGEGIAAIAGLMVGMAAAAAEANAQANMQAMAMQAAQVRAQAEANAMVQRQSCLQWLPVVYDQRYDQASRMQAMQIVSSCGIPAVAPVR